MRKEKAPANQTETALPIHESAHYIKNVELEQRIDLLKHLACHSRVLILVTAVSGMGKSALKQQFLTAVSDSLPTYTINASQVSTAQQMLIEISKGFNILELDPEVSVPKNLQTLMIKMQESETDGIFVIDDAHQLNAACLQTLIRLLELEFDSRQYLHILLFAEPSLTANIDAAMVEAGADLEVHTITLEPLSQADTMHYAQQKLSALSVYNKHLFTPTILRQVFDKTEGVPALIDKELTRLLKNAIEQQKSSPDDKQQASRFSDADTLVSNANKREHMTTWPRDTSEAEFIEVKNNKKREQQQASREPTYRASAAVIVAERRASHGLFHLGNLKFAFLLSLLVLAGIFYAYLNRPLTTNSLVSDPVAIAPTSNSAFDVTALESSEPADSFAQAAESALVAPELADAKAVSAGTVPVSPPQPMQQALVQEPTLPILNDEVEGLLHEAKENPIALQSTQQPVARQSVAEQHVVLDKKSVPEPALPTASTPKHMQRKIIPVHTSKAELEKVNVDRMRQIDTPPARVEPITVVNLANKAVVKNAIEFSGHDEIVANYSVDGDLASAHDELGRDTQPKTKSSSDSTATLTKQPTQSVSGKQLSNLAKSNHLTTKLASSMKPKSAHAKLAQSTLTLDTGVHYILNREQLLQASPGHYTLQLLGVNDPSGLQHYIKAQQLQGKAAALRIERRDGSSWYIVILGNYPSYQAAKEAIKTLPVNLQKNNPWVQKIMKLQQEVASDEKKTVLDRMSA